LRLGEEKRKKEDIDEEETTRQKYNGLPYSIGRPLTNDKAESVKPRL